MGTIKGRAPIAQHRFMHMLILMVSCLWCDLSRHLPAMSSQNSRAVLFEAILRECVDDFVCTCVYLYMRAHVMKFADAYNAYGQCIISRAEHYRVVR